MYVTGSLPSLGCWDAKRARKMAKGKDGSWILAVYIPERAEFLYQYLLLEDSTDAGKDPVVIWEGALERKCKLDNAGATPNKQFLLSDDTRGEGSSPTPKVLSYTKTEIASSASKVMSEQEKQDMQEEMNELIQERNRCQNELLKLKDILAAAVTTADGSDFKKRESYIPDSGALYDTIRQIQAIIRSRPLRGNAKTIDEEVDNEDSVQEDVDSLRKQIEELGRVRREIEESFAEERHDLTEKCQLSQAGLEAAQQELTEERSKRQAARADLAAGFQRASSGLREVRATHAGIRGDMLEVRRSVSDLVGRAGEEINAHVARIAGAMQSEMERAGAKLKKEVVERRRLHNLVQELKGNIRVFCRVRPLSQKDVAAGQRPAVTFPGENEVSIDVGGKAQGFQYAAVFDPASTQEAVFEETQPLVTSVLDGFNVCIFAYGQTGSGKTHTMQASGAPLPAGGPPPRRRPSAARGRPRASGRDTACSVGRVGATELISVGDTELSARLAFHRAPPAGIRRAALGVLELRKSSVLEI